MGNVIRRLCEIASENMTEVRNKLLNRPSADPQSQRSCVVLQPQYSLSENFAIVMDGCLTQKESRTELMPDGIDITGIRGLVSSGQYEAAHEYISQSPKKGIYYSLLVRLLLVAKQVHKGMSLKEQQVVMNMLITMCYEPHTNPVYHFGLSFDGHQNEVYAKNKTSMSIKNETFIKANAPKTEYDSPNEGVKKQPCFFALKPTSVLERTRKLQPMKQKKIRKQKTNAKDSHQSNFRALEHLLFAHLVDIRRSISQRFFRQCWQLENRPLVDDHLPPGVSDYLSTRKEQFAWLGFASLMLSACKPLHYDFGPVTVYSGLMPAPDDETHLPLFAHAVEFNLVEEARLLYETGGVNNKELAVVAQTEKVNKMLARKKVTPMATFLRSTLRHPRSLQCLASIEVSRLLRDDVQGRQYRARSVGLPEVLCKEVLFINQVTHYLSTVKSKYEIQTREDP